MTYHEYDQIQKGLDAIVAQLQRVNAALEELVNSLTVRSLERDSIIQDKAVEDFLETGKWPGENK